MKVPPTIGQALKLIAVATVLGLVATGQHLLAMRMIDRPDYHTVTHALKSSVPGWYLWALLAPVVGWFVQRVSFERRRWLLPLLLHLGFAIAIVITHALLGEVVDRVIDFPSADHHPFSQTAAKILQGLLWNAPWSLASYAAVAGSLLSYHYYRRFREREIAAALLTGQLAEARLAALRHRLSPHFLFNSMNTIAMLVRMNRPADAIRTIAGLSELLRVVLVDEDRDEVSLAAELDLIRQYLEIEQIRFEDRLQVSIEATPESLRVEVPRLMLQPIVENAIRHGIGTRAGDGTIAIKAVVTNHQLRIAIEDNGPGLGAPPAPGTGVGIKNVEQRLATRYGAAAAFSLGDRPGGGAVATVTIPLPGGATR